jgi:glycosyltransferase involved in cell wall biosynthesis
VLLGKGPLLEDAKNIAIKLSIADRVIFAGFHNNPFPFINAAKALIVSSDFEGFSMVILEALFLKIPVVSTDCPSGPSEILPKSNLVPVGDVGALTKKINDILESPNAFKVEFNDVFFLRIVCVNIFPLMSNSSLFGFVR